MDAKKMIMFLQMIDSLRLSLLGKKIEKWISSIMGAEITLKKSLKKIEEFLLKGTTRKTII